jgi:hypothetical protein
MYHKLKSKRLSEIVGIIEEHRDEIIQTWKEHFRKR